MSYPELPEHPREGRLVSPEAADAALVRKPQIGDTRPAPIQPVAPGDEVGSRSSKKIGLTKRGRQKSSSSASGSSPRARNLMKLETAKNQCVVIVAVVEIVVVDLAMTIRVQNLFLPLRPMPS